MSAQTRYGYNPPIGLAGGIVDLAPYAIDTFTNEENSGVVKHGMGVIRGTHNNCFKLPATGTEANAFVEECAPCGRQPLPDVEEA